MMKTLSCRLLSFYAFLTLTVVLLGGCAARGVPQNVFDLGTPQPVQHDAGLPPISVAAPTMPSWLDSVEMAYRLDYANDQQLRPYTNSRWSMPPVQLFTQRLKSRLADAGGPVLSYAENASNVPFTLYIDADDFTQLFDRPDHSTGRIALRISLFNGRKLMAQKSFVAQSDATGNDAAGGARALTKASDAMIADILQWLLELNLKN